MRNDLVSIGGSRSFPNRPTKKKEIFAASFKRYAEIWKDGGWNDHQRKVYEAMVDFLNLENIEVYVQAVEDMTRSLTAPTFPKDISNYVELIYVIFGDSCWRSQFSVGDDSYLQMILEMTEGEIPIPCSRRDLEETYLKFMLDQYRAKIMPVLTSDVIPMVDRALEKLEKRQQCVIVERFGLQGRKRKTLEEIGEAWGISRERVRQIEAKALLNLRNPEVSAELRVVTQPAGGSFEREMARRKEQEAADLLAERIAAGEFDETPQNLKLLEELPWQEMSVRSTNCLWDSGYRLYGELVQAYPFDIQKIRNVGRKSLNEIQAVLADEELALGMKLDSRMKTRIEKARAELDPNEPKPSY
ncbi:MAG: hypothetical protein JRJ87_27535 [Deltaproteobacteria bacterium]|nr:hypothetical protein [Deltaproteobacteria bacterium]